MIRRKNNSMISLQLSYKLSFHKRRSRGNFIGDRPPRLFAEREKKAASNGLVPEQHDGHFEFVGQKRLNHDVGFALVVRTPDGDAHLRLITSFKFASRMEVMFGILLCN